MQTHPQSEEDWKPGFAKRADNFEEVCRRASTWRWRPGETVSRVCAAILKGTPQLTQGQRQTLMLYAEHLNQERLEQGNACVWPGSALIAAYLGCADRVARGHRKALEAAGYMVRDFNHANRPAGVEAFNLAPLMARLEEMEAADDAIRQEIADRRAAYLAPVVQLQSLSGHPDSSSRQEQSHPNERSSVTQADAPMARNSSFARQATPAAGGHTSANTGYRTARGHAAHGSPRGASGLAETSSAGAPAAEMHRQELAAALQACPRVARLLPPHVLANPAGAGPAEAAAIAEAAQQLLPEPERNNDRTALWGWRRHGLRVVVMLAIALEDPAVKNPCSYFGKLALAPPGAALDLRVNLTRILRAKGAAQSSPPAPQATAPASPALPTSVQPGPGADHPTWLAIQKKLRKIIGDGPHGAWFAQVGFAGIVDGVLALTAPHGLAAQKIEREYLPALRRAAVAAEVNVDRVLITSRRDYSGSAP
jgi:hypothetical protein